MPPPHCLFWVNLNSVGIGLKLENKRRTVQYKTVHVHYSTYILKTIISVFKITKIN